jgi:CHAD domain-containing protein
MIYVIDCEGQLIKLAERIAMATGAEILSKHEELVELAYLDSFDWLFHQSGVKLQTETGSTTDGKKIILRWIPDRHPLSPPAAIHLDKLPETAADLPVGKMHDSINKILGLRSLIPVARIRSRQVKLVMRDHEGKTLCRLTLEHNHARPKLGRRSLDLGCRLRLEALVGYEKAFTKTAKLLKKVNGLAAAKDDLFIQALNAAGRSPGDYSSRINFNLKREWRTDKACREILLSQLDQLERNIEGTIAGTDTEFLHDLRVSVRRSRSLVDRMKVAFPKSIYDRFSKELTWLGDKTTPLRDMDVFMLDFPKYLESLRSELRVNLTPLHDFFIAHHKSEQVILAKHLHSRRLENFRVKWRKYLEQPIPKKPVAQLSTRPIGEVADRYIWKSYRHLIKKGLTITQNSPDVEIHKIRITCKKLRYLLEFFSSLYSNKEVKEIVSTLKNVQENLGEFQDMSVQAVKLSNVALEMIAEGEKRPDALMAIDNLITKMNNKKQQVRLEFDERFSRFASAKVEKKFRKLCKKNKSGKREIKTDKTVKNKQ